MKTIGTITVRSDCTVTIRGVNVAKDRALIIAALERLLEWFRSHAEHTV